MTYNMFGGTLNLAQSIIYQVTPCLIKISEAFYTILTRLKTAVALQT